MSLTLVFAWISLAVATSPPVSAPESAGCFIKSDKGLLLVSDLWSKTWSLPGGGIELNESATAAAERETMEETGIGAQAKEQIASYGRFALFRCVPLKAIGLPLVPPSSAKNEIAEVKLQSEFEMQNLRWRFPSQTKSNLALFQEEKPTTATLDQPLPRSPWVERELSAISLLQSKTRSFHLLWKVFNFLGEESFFYFAVPLFWLVFPWRTGASFTLLLLVTAIANGHLKDLFEFLRPFHYEPALQQASAHGFGFPSGHAQIAAVFWLFLASFFRNRFFTALALFLTFSCGVARAYFGVHFFYDVAGGWLAGILTIGFYFFFKRRNLLRWDYGVSTASVLTFFALGAVSLTFRSHPEGVSAIATAMGVLFGFRFYRVEREFLTRSLPSIHTAVLRWLLGALGMVAIVAVFSLLQPAEKTFLSELLHRVVKYFLLGMWLSLGSFIVARRVTVLTPKRA